MEYTEQELIGLKVKHKDYKIGDPMGVYIIGSQQQTIGKVFGVWYYSSGSIIDSKLSFCDYTLDQIIDNIKRSVWILLESEVINNYQIF